LSDEPFDDVTGQPLGIGKIYYGFCSSCAKTLALSGEEVVKPDGEEVGYYVNYSKFSTCSKCNGTGKISTTCSHSKSASHKYCSHNSNGVQHD